MGPVKRTLWLGNRGTPTPTPAPGVTAINPLTLTPMASFDANRSTMFPANNGTGTMTVGNQVKWISDVSGNSRTATNSAGTGPGLSTDATLSKNYLTYVSNGFQNLRSAAFTQADPITVFVLFRQRSWVGSVFLCSSLNATSACINAQSANTGTLNIFDGTASSATPQTVSDGVWHVATAVFTGGSDSSLQIDNQTVSVGSCGAVGINAGVALGNGPSSDGLAHSGNFDIMQWHFFAGAMSAANIAGVKKFIGADAGLSL